MNWLKSLWSKLVSKTSVSPTLAMVEEEDERSVGEIFYDICREAGISHKELTRLIVVPAFVEWYTGEPDERSIRDSVEAFKSAHTTLRPKLARLS